MSKHLKQLLIALGLALLATSCGIEEFATKKNKDALSTNPIVTSTATQCSQFTYIKQLSVHNLLILNQKLIFSFYGTTLLLPFLSMITPDKHSIKPLI